jgi:hypothetical protein
MEDMIARFQELDYCTELGPATSLARAEDDPFYQIEFCLDSIKKSMFENGKAEEWLDLAKAMDKVERKVTGFKIRTLKQSAGATVCYASGLEEEMERVLERARSSLNIRKIYSQKLLPTSRRIDARRHGKQFSVQHPVKRIKIQFLLTKSIAIFHT